MLTLYSIIPSMESDRGHFHEYNNALSKSARINGWQHVKLIPKTCVLQNLSEDWRKVLIASDSKKKFKALKNILPFIKLLKEIKKINAVLFLEDFNIVHLIALIMALLVVRPKIKMCLMHRYEHERMLMNGHIYYFVHGVLEKMLGKSNVKYLADTQLLCKKNQSFFNRSFTVVPISHTYDCISKEEKQLCQTYLWPGGITREEKGLKYIQRLASLITADSNIKLIMSESARCKVANSENIVFLSSKLSRDEYIKWMQRADLILLPYLTELYRYRSSGIFIEAIIAEKIPVTTVGTWMAHELISFSLNELIIDWDDVNILKTLKSLCSNAEIESKLQIMRNHYKRYHSVENFASVLKQMI